MDDLSFDFDPDIENKVAHHPFLLGESQSAAQKIADVARDTAPVESGDYKAGIVVQATKSGARVFASDYKSAWIEFGAPTNGEPAHFNLRRAAEAAGFTFRKRN